MKNVNILLGRFQPFTKGHEKILQLMFKENNLPTVILLIKNIKFDIKHPFSDDLISDEIYFTLKNKKYFESKLYVKNANIGDFSKILHDANYEPVLWGCGSDRFNDFNRQAERYKHKFNLLDDFRAFEITRTNEDISATKVRDAIKNDDLNLFKKMMPDGAETFWDKFKHELSLIKESKIISLINYINDKII